MRTCIERLRRVLAARLRRALPLALAFLLGSAWPVWSQVAPGNGQLSVRSDGFIFWIQDGLRHPVYPAPLADEQINAFPEGAPLNAALVVPPANPGPGQPPVAQPSGRSRADRLGVGQPCLCSVVRGTGARSDLTIQVTQVDRDAWPKIRSTNPSNQPPREGYEFILVRIKVDYREGPPDLPFSVDRFDFTVLDANDMLYTPAFVIEPGQPLGSQTIYPRSTVEGLIAYQVPRDSRDIVLVWQYNSDNPTWFGLF